MYYYTLNASNSYLLVYYFLKNIQKMTISCYISYKKLFLLFKMEHL
jgi:hypothetical protein